MRPILAAAAVLVSFATLPVTHAAVITYGTPNLEGFGYPGNADPTVGATEQGLAPNVVTLATNAYPHAYPFSPALGDYPGTHQIYVGQNQTTSDDGYSRYSGRIAGPQVVTLDYSSLVPAGQTLTTLTLGLGADDFQFPAFGNPFTASINGLTDSALANQLMSLNQTGPYEQYFSIGINPATLLPSNILTLSINEGGNGGDGWALDFLTIGVTTTPAPEPTSLALLTLGTFTLLIRRKKEPVA
jgi:hypothetical protein